MLRVAALIGVFAVASGCATPEVIDQTTRTSSICEVHHVQIQDAKLHYHERTDEFYYVISGRGIMAVGGEEREIGQGDLVHIPPDAVHSLRPVSDNAPIHCFCFAVGVKDASPVDYTEH